MKHLTSICLVLFLTVNYEKSVSQGFNETKVKDTLDYSLGIELPIFVGGDSALEDYIRKNFDYSRNIQNEGIAAGPFRLNFIVDKEGKVTEDSIAAIDFLTGVLILDDPYNTGHKGKAFRNHILEILESSPNWIPGHYNGQAIAVRLMMDIYVNSGANSGTKRVKIVDNISQTALNKKKDNFYYNKAIKFSDEGNFLEAIHHFSLALLYNSRDVDALYNRGIAKYRSNDIAGACADWSSIKSLGKTDADELLKRYCDTK